MEETPGLNGPSEQLHANGLLPCLCSLLLHLPGVSYHPPVPLSSFSISPSPVTPLPRFTAVSSLCRYIYFSKLLSDSFGSFFSRSFAPHAHLDLITLRRQICLYCFFFFRCRCLAELSDDALE